MGNSGFWFGYLHAGDKSSAVLRDPDLDTGNRKTVFLFNLERNKIIEYNREIVEAKLRGLNGQEAELVPALEAGYAIARQGLASTRAKARAVSETAAAPAPKTAKEDDLDDADIVLDDDFADDIDDEPA